MRLLRTAGHLRAGQITSQINHRLRGWIEDPRRVQSSKVPPYPGCRWRPVRSFLPPVQKQTAESILSGQFTFLNQLHTVGWPPEWNPPAAPRLWRYNLHYFDWIWALDFQDALAATLNWAEHHTPDRDATGWEPYPTSLRLMNWCGFFWPGAENRLEKEPAARDKVWASIYRQTRWLASHRETHLCGNHLLENAAALTAVGCCFNGAQARQWRHLGLKVLSEQIAEQFLSDGAHYERSPMYHSRAMYVLLFLYNLGEPDVSKLVRPSLKDGIEALKCMTHPDGKIALLNDSAWGIYNDPQELSLAAEASWPPAAGVFSLPESGYYGARTDDGSYIICDAGPIGPDHQPGHAHGDTFSFELSLRGHRVIVDSGVFDYEPGAGRSYGRSTRGHNTVEIGNQDQSEFWGTFRVGRRARVGDVDFHTDGNAFHLAAAHDGYRRLHGSPQHHRDVQWCADGSAHLTDSISTASRIRCVSRLHFHPDCTILKCGATNATIQYAAGTVNVEFGGAGKLAVEESEFYPEFGKRCANTTLAFSGEATGITELTCRIRHE